ncbi:MAG: hypothetical protein JWQ97_1272 [Phenylobacterium sp.]|nr:hypothetical protein [Phenylobacterium sp.]
MPETELKTRAVEAPPQPLPSLDSEPFWDHLAKGQLAIQRCEDCRAWQFPMIARCRHCAGELAMEPLSGRGSIYTYIVEHRKVAPGFDELLPYVIALVTPEEAPHVRIPSRIPDLTAEEVRVGMPVKVSIEPLAGGDYRIPVFRAV